MDKYADLSLFTVTSKNKIYIYGKVCRLKSVYGN